MIVTGKVAPACHVDGEMPVIVGVGSSTVKVTPLLVPAPVASVKVCAPTLNVSLDRVAQVRGLPILAIAVSEIEIDPRPGDRRGS